MRFYRGIAVPGDRKVDVIAHIRGRGLLPDDGRYSYRITDLKPRLVDLRRLPVVTIDDTKIESSPPTWVCACADETGATYYATKHNRYKGNDTPILICFNATLPHVIIDGRDFLYTVFQNGDPQRARPFAEKIYGPGILQYLDRAWATTDQSQRIALCHLAVQDDDVIRAHFKNKIVIAGRYNTRFCSAFMVQTPVPAKHIISVEHVEREVHLPEPDVTIPMIRPTAKFVIG